MEDGRIDEIPVNVWGGDRGWGSETRVRVEGVFNYPLYFMNTRPNLSISASTGSCVCRMSVCLSRVCLLRGPWWRWGYIGGNVCLELPPACESVSR